MHDMCEEASETRGFSTHWHALVEKGAGSTKRQQPSSPVWLISCSRNL